VLRDLDADLKALIENLEKWEAFIDEYLKQKDLVARVDVERCLKEAQEVLSELQGTCSTEAKRTL
jgi:uncharacterized protein (DUF2249 family)